MAMYIKIYLTNFTNKNISFLEIKLPLKFKCKMLLEQNKRLGVYVMQMFIQYKSIESAD